MTTFTGLTWDHPRGYDALAEAARRLNAARATPLLHWNKQPLEGFESAPIAELAAANDLLVLDHPHIGEAVAEDCLIPLEELFPEAQIASWARQSIGPAMRSYRWGGRHWALPLDVATQTMVCRADMVSVPPESWEAVAELARRQPVALSLAGPHAVLTLLSLCGSKGVQPQGERFLPDAQGAWALGLMHRLFARRPVGSEALNPIALSEKMARSDEIALIPLVFNYVTYAVAAGGRQPLTFSGTPRTADGFGGVIGGTGIGFTRRCRPVPELLEHIAWLMAPETQTGFFPAHGGQPSARAAWHDAQVNATWGGFYRACADTADHALLRPRFDGYIAFQTAASERLRRALETREDELTTLSALRGLWLDARNRARGNPDDNKGADND